jgi:cytochrome c oxidase subunit 2
MKNAHRSTWLLGNAVLLLLAASVGSAGSPLRLQAPTQQPSIEVRLTAERFSFTPSRITVARGAIVEIVAESEDTTHGFHLPDAALDEQIPARGKGELRLRFEAIEPGTYYFECSRPCGAGHNTMRGTIVVED